MDILQQLRYWQRGQFLMITAPPSSVVVHIVVVVVIIIVVVVIVIVVIVVVHIDVGGDARAHPCGGNLEVEHDAEHDVDGDVQTSH